tara:strand:+ start:4312 stop:5364 length:1053 start_codon:yes stop_codon:yes gene_type:complete
MNYCAKPYKSVGWHMVLGIMATVFVLMLGSCIPGGETIVVIATHPTNQKILYVASNNTLYKTRDGGDTWEKTSQSFTSDRVTALAVDPLMTSAVYAGTNGDGVYKSGDAGRTWHPFNSGLRAHVMIVGQFAFDPRDQEIAYLASTVGVYRSENRGRDWNEWMEGMKEVHFVVSIVAHPTNRNILYAGTSGGVYRTTTAGKPWKRAIAGMLPENDPATSMALGVNVLAIDPTTPEIVYAGTTKGLFKTTDSAESWVRIGEGKLSDDLIMGINIDPTSPNIIYVGHRAGIDKSIDHGKTWSEMNRGLTNLNVRTFVMSPHDSMLLYAGMNRGGLFRSTDGAETWVPILGNAE